MVTLLAPDGLLSPSLDAGLYVIQKPHRLALLFADAARSVGPNSKPPKPLALPIRSIDLRPEERSRLSDVIGACALASAGMAIHPVDALVDVALRVFPERRNAREVAAKV